MSLSHELKHGISPAFRLAVISLILCGLVFPLVVTGFAQVLFPSQANGSILTLGSRSIGSNYIAQNFSSGIFFHVRPSNSSASGVDPDITLENALAQVPRISGITGIAMASLVQIVQQHVQHTFGLVGDSYVNVLQLNLALIQAFPYYQAYR